MPIGPQLPATAEKRKRSDQSNSSDSDDSVGPLPPDVDQNDTVSKKARVLGPSLPPQIQRQQQPPAPKADSDSGDSSDDDFGPAMPTESDASGGRPSASTKCAELQTSSASASVAQSKRDEWMTLAPTSGDWSQRVDPTKMKNRKFNTGKSGSTSSAGADAWHETPEQKQARLQREVLGIKGEKGSKSRSMAPTTMEEDSETARRMQEYSKQRGPSLYDAHTKTHKVEKDDDPSARAFDREKDIAGGLQLNSTQRREMMKKSSDFNSRFGSAKYL